MIVYYYVWEFRHLSYRNSGGSIIREVVYFFFFKQKTAYEMRISDWSSDVCSSDLHAVALVEARAISGRHPHALPDQLARPYGQPRGDDECRCRRHRRRDTDAARSRACHARHQQGADRRHPDRRRVQGGEDRADRKSDVEGKGG